MQPAALLAAAQRAWSALPARARAGMLAAAALVLATGAIAALASRDTSVALFAAPLLPAQVAEVGDRLARWGVPFRAGADGVMVPRALRQQTLLRLSLAGVPHRPLPTSLETLADAGPLVPERILEVRQRAGLEGEIAQSLRTLEGITDARVIIAPGHEGTFADQAATPTTASVRLSLRTGAHLDAPRVRAVRAFVAASVPGLVPERVEVLDDRGSAGEDASVSTVDGNGLQTQVQSALDQVEGAGNTIVRVRIVRDDDAREVLQHRVLPAGGALRSESAQEQYRAGGTAYNSGKSTLDAGSDEREERASFPAGRVRRIAVAVFVDRSRQGDLSKIRELVEAAAGLDVRRGDDLRVEALDFARPRPPAASSPLPMLAALLLPSLFIAVAVIVAAWATRPLVVAAVAAARALALRRCVEREQPALNQAARLRAALDVEPPHAAAAVISALPASTAVAVLDLYPAQEREHIVRRMATARSEAIPPLEKILGKHS